MAEGEKSSSNNGSSSLLKDGKSSRSRRNSSGSDDSPVTHMRIGAEYQASVPPLETIKKNIVSRGPALTIWKPSKQLPDPLLLKYIELSRTKYGYREEQALGLLVCHGYNVEEANKDLANFVPYPDDWTTLEKQSFEHGFQEHGKDFHKIKMMLPDKSVNNLVKYYYIWKKTRSKYQTLKNKMKVKRNDSDDDSFDDNEHKTKRIRMGSSSLLTSSFTPSQMPIIQTLYNSGMSNTPCTNCHRAKAETVVTLKKEHLLCKECADYFTKYTTMRPLFEISIVKTDPSVEKVILNPPEGIDLTLESLKLVANMKDAHRYLACLTNQIMTFKAQIQTKKQEYKQMKSKIKKLNIEQYRPEKEVLKGGSSTRWTEEEIEMFKMSLERYGKDFEAASAILGNRTATQISSCFYSKRDKYSFEACVKTFDKSREESGSESDEKEDEKMEIDEKPEDNEVIVISENPPSKTPSSTSSPTSSSSSPRDFVFKMQIGGITRPIRLQRLPITFTSEAQQSEPMVIDLTDDENDSRPELELTLTKNEPVKFVQNAVRKVISNINMNADDDVQILDYS